MTEWAIEVKDLRVDYGDFTALKSVSFTIAKGEIYGLVGPNGAGKTSTLNVLATLLSPTYGNVKILGHDLLNSPNDVREKLGYMPDLAPTVKNLKVWEFLDLYGASHGLSVIERKSRIEEYLSKVKMYDKRDVFCGTLSRGMTQRVVLAKTLMHRPEVLLLDEPASGMDPMSRLDLKLVLKELCSEGKTIILSSHILSELSEMATAVGILHLGEFKFHGTVSEVLGSVDKGDREIHITLSSDLENCMNWLNSQGLKSKYAEKSENTLMCHLSGTDEDQIQLLKSMMNEGFPVLEFSSRKSNLEDLLHALKDEPEAEGDEK